MCGRFSLHSNAHVVALQFGLAQPFEVAPRYNIAPAAAIVAIRADSRHVRSASLFQWGLIPAWSKSPAIALRLVNARAEHLAEKPAFRNALRWRRCIVPADGFYEWQGSAGHKQPFYIRPRADELFGLAALYEYWQGPSGVVASCAIITTAANSLMRGLHDRMPAILTAADYSHWLDPDHPDPASLPALLRPLASEHMLAYPVGLRVNNARNDDPSLIEADTQTAQRAPEGELRF
ncbi:MAG: SOS response-associated peptidase [Burkholderiales bacterium]|nr:SOS response-associated peptidase [Burkholderiales bacterium]